MYQYECFYSRINPSIIGTQTEYRYKLKGKEVRNSESTTSLLSHNINNEIIMDNFKCSFLSIGYLLRIKKCILKTFFLKLIR